MALPSEADTNDNTQRPSWFTRLSSLRWRTALFVVASVVGCQAMAASRQISAPVVLLIPEGLESARQSFLQGLVLGEQAVRACGAEPVAMVIQSLGWDDDPTALFPRDADNQPVLPPLVVAPYAADLRSFSRLAQDGDARVLLGHQRGPSLDSLSGLDEQGRLLPLLPSRRDDLRALAQAAIDRGWTRVMVVSDPTALEGDFAQPFVELFEGLGGTVLSYTQDDVQSMTPGDRERWALLTKDLDWLGPDALVLAAPPDGDLAVALRERQIGSLSGHDPGWIWLLSSPQASAVSAQPWPQIVLSQPAHGPNWNGFTKAFSQRWGYAPDLIAAAGFETSRVLALSSVGPSPLASDGTRDPLAWVAPSAQPVSLCRAIALRREGESARLEGVASDFALRPGRAPTGVAETHLIPAQ